MSAARAASASVAAPPPLARRWVARVVGFGIAVGLGMAPFLGKVAGVDALLDIFPKSMRGTLIPLSVFLMGIVAMAVQYSAGETLSRPRLRRRFVVSCAGLLLGLLLFVAFYTLFVLPVPYVVERRTEGAVAERVEGSEPVLVAWSRVPGCGCAAELSDLECLQAISTQPPAIESCWGSRPLQLARLGLSVSYLALTGGFAALVGLLVLQEEIKRRRPAGQRQPARRSRKPPGWSVETSDSSSQPAKG